MGGATSSSFKLAQSTREGIVLAEQHKTDLSPRLDLQAPNTLQLSLQSLEATSGTTSPWKASISSINRERTKETEVLSLKEKREAAVEDWQKKLGSKDLELFRSVVEKISKFSKAKKSTLKLSELPRLTVEEKKALQNSYKFWSDAADLRERLTRELHKKDKTLAKVVRRTNHSYVVLERFLRTLKWQEVSVASGSVGDISNNWGWGSWQTHNYRIFFKDEKEWQEAWKRKDQALKEVNASWNEELKSRFWKSGCWFKNVKNNEDLEWCYPGSVARFKEMNYSSTEIELQMASKMLEWMGQSITS
ncbi:hypothetical protein MHLP_03345 [Candidatus Mycoplasma haematolamae str. Purdue]|uniref:Uncharacterized protein n=1 Tax=Mycoplasma haematolamae (strain Purdue) TaxID=1212765 RepID=I7CK39_MYCHA|nr:hypothetical protein [Candidatus Mycoplasma haematolamae]AFO52249.1 hypothetical protein MHLP_03345 [Candidatus Mycoplasma haematolamae str. Purdue]